MSTVTITRSWSRDTAVWVSWLLIPAGLIWSYWSTLVELFAFWQTNQDYSVGQLVPLVAGYLIWADRKRLRALPVRVCWWGLTGLVFAQAVRFAGLYYDYVSFERYSFVLTLGSLCWLLFGSAVVRRCGWVLVFLFLMLPLPGRVHTAVTLPLQGFATRSATFVLDMLGYWVVREGNVLQVNENTRAAVAEACNGLRMLSAFVFVAAVLAFLVKRPAWQRAVVVASAIPIAVFANTARLVVTVILCESVDSGLADRFFHDFAGVAMMPVAIALVIGELWLLRWLADGARTTREPLAKASAAAAPDPVANVARCPRHTPASRP